MALPPVGGAAGAARCATLWPIPGTRGQRSWGRIWLTLGALVAVFGLGTLGYWLLGYTPLDALFQSVTTVTTVGFAQSHPLGTAGKVFTVVLVLVGVGTAFYAFGLLLEVLVEGQLARTLWRRRMDRTIARMAGHIIVCGWGRVGQVIAEQLVRRDVPVVVVDADPLRVEGLDRPYVLGDATDDAVIEAAGVRRARALVTAMSTDVANLYVTLSARTINPDLFIVGRVRVAASEEKLRRAGADRVVNPQAIGGARIAAMLVEPHVAEFLDVVTHEAGVEFRLSELTLAPGSPLAGCTLGGAHIRRATGALVLAVRDPSGSFLTNPTPETVMTGGQVLIAIGTQQELAALAAMAGDEVRPPGRGRG